MRLFDVLKFFREFIGLKIYLIFILSLIATFLEGIGFIMFIPLISLIDRPKENIDLNTNISPDLNEYLLFLFNFEIKTIFVLIIIFCTQRINIIFCTLIS